MAWAFGPLYGTQLQVTWDGEAKSPRFNVRVHPAGDTVLGLNLTEATALADGLNQAILQAYAARETSNG